MTPADADLVECWRLERLGAAYFAGVAAASEEPDATTARLLEAIERKMAAELLAELRTRRLRPPEPTIEEPSAATQTGRQSGWSGFAGSVSAGVAPAIALYRRMGERDPELAPIADLLIRHERLLEEAAHLPAAAAQQRLRQFLEFDVIVPPDPPATTERS